MRKIISVLLICLSLTFTSCFETISETSIKADGSGTLSVVMDMGKLFELAAQMGKDPEKEEEAAKDSTFDFKEHLAEIEKERGKPLTADEKALLENTTGRLQMNVKEKLMKISVNSKFTKLSQLSLLPQIQKMAMDKSPMDDEAGEENEDAQAEKMTDFAAKPAEAMSFSVADGLIQNVFDKAKYELSDEEKAMMQQMDQAKVMLGKMPMTVIYNLPRPVKSVTTDAKYELSEDKKTVTITYDFLEVFTNPGIQAYKVEY